MQLKIPKLTTETIKQSSVSTTLYQAVAANFVDLRIHTQTAKTQFF